MYAVKDCTNSSIFQLMTSCENVTYVVGEDDAPFPDLILPIDVRQAAANTNMAYLHSHSFKV